MNKFLSKVLASILAVAMVASFSYVEAPEKAGKSQLDLVSIKAVDVQNSVTGVRAYSDIVNTERAYQDSDVIFLATTVEVKNIALSDYKNLDSIKGKSLDLIVGSPDIDLSFSKSANPVVISAIYSGYSDQNIGMIGVPGVSAAASEVVAIKTVAKYNKDKNEVKVTFKGRELNTTSAIDYLNIGASVGTDGKISIPALRSTNDKKVTFQIGAQKYEYKYDAPKSVQYSLVLTGVTKPHGDKAKGEYYAKLMIKSAEEFVAFGSYYIDLNSKVVTAAEIAASKYVEYVDYIKVEVEKLEVEGGYNVYKYIFPSSGLVNDLQVRYMGDAAVADEATRILAWVNPAKWDYNTGKAPKTHNPDVAASVNSNKAYNGNQDGEGTTPTTSLVYTTDKTFYAPFFYNGIFLKNVEDTSAGNQQVKYRQLGPVKNQEGENIIAWNNNDLKINITVPKTDGYVTTFTNSAAPTATDILNGIKDANGIVINRTSPVAGTVLADYTKNWYAAEKDYRDAYNTAAKVATAYAGPTGTVTDVVTAIATSMNTFNAANAVLPAIAVAPAVPQNHWAVAVAPKSKAAPAALAAASAYPTTGVSAIQAYAISPADVQTDVVAAITAAITAPAPTGTDLALKNEWTAYFGPAPTKFADPKDVKEGNLPPTLVTAINNHISVDGVISQYHNLDNVAGVLSVAPATVTAAATAVAAVAAQAAPSATNFPKNVAAVQVNTVDAAKINVPATFANGANYFVAYSWQALSNAVLDAAEAKVSYTLNGTNVSVVLLPSTANTTKAVTEKWIVNVTYNTRTQQAVASLGTSGTEEVSVSGFFSPANVDLRLPADTEFTVKTNVDSSKVTSPNASALPVYGSDVTRAGDVLVKGSNATVFNTDPTKYQLWIAKNTDGTINRVGILVLTDKNGNQSPWAGGPNRLPATGTSTFTPDVRAAFKTSGTAKRGVPVGLHKDVVDNNGIVVYTITEPANDRPVISIATEKTYFAGDDGYGIALFENKHSFSQSNISNDNKINKMVINRVYRSNNENFSNVYTAGYASTSSDMINGIKFFGLDASFGTTYKVLDADFDKKGAAAVFTDEVKGEFTYGVITVVEDLVDEKVEETEVPATEETEETTEVEATDAVEETEAPVVANPKTGDASANVAIALAASAMVAAAGLAFVLNKRSN